MSSLPVPPAAPRIVRLSRAWGYAWAGMLGSGITAALMLVLAGSLLVLFAGADLSGRKDAQLDAENDVASGRILEAVPLHMHAGKDVAIRYRFEYRVDEGPRQEGVSYGWTSAGFEAPGTRVAVDFLPDDHGVARVAGTRLTPLPPWVWILLLGLHLTADLVFLFYLRRALRRRRLLETGRAVPGTITALTRRPWINPTPAVLRYTFEDPATGDRVEATCWLRAARVRLGPSDLPAPCLVAAAEDLSGRSRLLAIPGWQAWEATTFAPH